jgi:hypothetical protein
MAARLRRKFRDKQRHYKPTNNRYENNEDPSRTRRRVSIRVVEKGKLPKKKKVVDETNKPPKCDCSEPGHDANKNRNQ